VNPSKPFLARLGALAASALLVTACVGGGEVKTILSNVGEAPAPQPSAAPSVPAGCPTSQPAPLPKGEHRTVTIETAKGKIVIDVEADLAPIATGNFVALAQCGYYDGVVFHRVVPQFVIQGGDGQYGREPNRDPVQIGRGGPGYMIADEPVTIAYGRGVIAMARTRDPNSQGSQFFIVLDDAARDALESANTYAILGHVTSGMETADAIAAAADQQIPTNPVAMDKVTVSVP
jgi:peptidyl-prolyl cis-trans isomerase B (cyclophilin B)